LCWIKSQSSYTNNIRKTVMLDKITIQLHKEHQKNCNVG
jgi:hypothetical protein